MLSLSLSLELYLYSTCPLEIQWEGAGECVMRAVVPRRYTHGKEMGFDGLNLGYYVGMGRICGISV